MPNNKTDGLMLKLADPGVPLAHKAQQVIDVMAGVKEGERACAAAAEELFQRLHEGSVNEEAQAKAQQLDEIMSQIQASPLRQGRFVEIADVEGKGIPHALIQFDNGESAYVVVYDRAQARKLKLGDPVMVDAKMKLLVSEAPSELYPGTESRLERKVDDRHVEVLTHQDERSIALAGPELIRSIETGETRPGSKVVMSKNNQLALRALPEAANTHYRFLDRGPVPDVRVDRDIGSPPRIIGHVALHIREEMTRPELRRKFRLRPCITRLLCGVSGTGKTLAIQAIHRLMYEIMSEITETPVPELPARVFRMRSSQMLSMWFGESDKNIDRLFDEVEQLADEKFKEHVLPVMVVLEEADGLGRARGGDNIYDRIMTVILQRLDPNREGLANKLVIFLSTTNTAEVVDPAFLRRIGGAVETFGRLDPKGFADIMAKHLSGLPTKEKSLLRKVCEHLFENGDNGVVELTYQGHADPVIKYRRDFLTGALIDRAVQQAAEAAWHESLAEDKSNAGITAEALSRAIEDQVRSVAHQLHPDNVHNYTDLPDGVRVSRVRRITQNA